MPARIVQNWTSNFPGNGHGGAFDSTQSWDSGWRNGWQIADALAAQQANTDAGIADSTTAHELAHQVVPNQSTKTVEAILDPITVLVAYGQPGTGSINVGANFQRAATTTQSNLEGKGYTVFNVGEISSVYGFQNMLDMAAKYKASGIFIFAHGATDAIDIGDGARTDQKDITMNSVKKLVNHGFSGSIVIKACYTGASTNGIAAALSKQLGVRVEAPTAGMSFSPYPDRLGTSRVQPSTGPTYMVPEGNGTYREFAP